MKDERYLREMYEELPIIQSVVYERNTKTRPREECTFNNVGVCYNICHACFGGRCAETCSGFVEV